MSPAQDDERLERAREALRYAELRHGVTPEGAPAGAGAEAAFLVVDGAVLMGQRRNGPDPGPLDDPASLDRAALLPVDRGRMVVTDRRILFLGAERTVVWPFDQLLAVSVAEAGSAVVSFVEMPVIAGIRYDPSDHHRVAATVMAAIARFDGPEPYARLLDDLRAEVAAAADRQPLSGA